MIVERDASESEMVLEFLRAENPGPLTGSGADLSNVVQNHERARQLGHRGYTSRTALFTKFPTDVAWKRVRFTRQDFPSLRYLRYSPWRELTDNDLCVTVGASRIIERSFDETIPGIWPLVSKVEAIAQAIRHGADLPPVILVGVGDYYIIVEGTHRVTAFVVAQTDRPMLALLGSSPSMIEWSSQPWS